MHKKGYIHVYTGNGKGKTTSAVGLAVRARGNGFRICYVYFHKNARKWGYAELKMLEKIGVDVIGFAKDAPCFQKVINKKKFCNECQKGLMFIEKVFEENNYDMLVIDEINICIREGFMEEDSVVSLIKKKPLKLELILTGRDACEKIVKIADLVTEMKEIKHYYKKGVLARKGIER